MCILTLDNYDPFPGIGNVFLMLGAYYDWCLRQGTTPVICTAYPGKIVGIRKELFSIIETLPPGAKTFEMHFSLAILNEHTRRGMERIVDVPTLKSEQYKGLEAGFAFRFGDTRFDKNCVFMNDVGVHKMVEKMRQYTRVFVCSNNNAFVQQLKKVFPHIVTCNTGEGDTRFDSAHLLDWAALSLCPVVYHHVKTIGSPDSEITTTFAPSAALYGKARVVGMDNHGNIFEGSSYHW
jgi:hypothetical protein